MDSQFAQAALKFLFTFCLLSSQTLLLLDTASLLGLTLSLLSSQTLLLLDTASLLGLTLSLLSS
jgi:hypothetical protein